MRPPEARATQTSWPSSDRRAEIRLGDMASSSGLWLFDSKSAAAPGLSPPRQTIGAGRAGQVVLGEGHVDVVALAHGGVDVSQRLETTDDAAVDRHEQGLHELRVDPADVGHQRLEQEQVDRRVAAAEVQEVGPVDRE